MHQALLANKARTLFDVCEQLLPPLAVAVHAMPDIFLRAATARDSLNIARKKTRALSTSRSFQFSFFFLKL